MKPSILRNLKLACVGFGLAMGALFPVYAGFFVEWKEGMFAWFVTGALTAGGLVGVANYWLVNMVLLRKLRRISEIATAISNHDISHRCSIESHDLIGEIVNSFNAMTENLRGMIGQISGATTQLASAAEEMSAITDESNRGVLNQQQDVEQVAMAMSEMTATVQDVARSAAVAAEINNSVASIREVSDQVAAGAQQGEKQPDEAVGQHPQIEQSANHHRIAASIASSYPPGLQGFLPARILRVPGVSDTLLGDEQTL